MEKKRERIGPREYAGDILKAAITLTLAQGTESAIDFVAGALDLVRAETEAEVTKRERLSRLCNCERCIS